MRTEIGIVAGKVLETLENQNRLLNLRELKLYIDEPDEEILMSLGALIRDGHIRARRSGLDIYIWGIARRQESYVDSREEALNV